MPPVDAAAVLEHFGFRRTEVRLRLLSVLAQESLPLRAEAILKKLPGTDSVTLYRALEAFADAGIIERSDFQHGHAHYELTVGRPHHHHVICDGCGTIADVPVSASERLDQEALKRTQGFSSINRHSLEFYGRCITCA